MADNVVIGTIGGTNFTLDSTTGLGKVNDIKINLNVLTAPIGAGVNATLDTTGYSKTSSSKITVSLANLQALGAFANGDIRLCTLPAKTRVKNVYLIITQIFAGAGLATASVAVGRTGALYIDYIVASDGIVAANTVYGDVVGERGANLTGYDLPAYAATTNIFAHIIITGILMNALTGGSFIVAIETELIP